MKTANQRRPQATNVQTKQPYQLGLGPNRELQTVAIVMVDLE